MSLAIRKMPLGFRLPPVRLACIFAAVLLLLGAATAAYGYWASITSSNAAAAADTLSPGSKPAVAADGTAVSVTWAGGTTVNGHAATGYTVTRYSEATGGTGTAAAGGCAGTVTTLTCTEQNLPAGVWYYSVTPAIALWTGEESPRSDGISTDADAPVATVQSVSPTPNTAGWNNTSPVTVTITADDGADGSGVASITYTLDGGAQQTVSGASATVPVSGDGTHTVSYFATDNSGNAGAAQTQTVRIDTSAPAAPTLSVPAYVNTANVAAVPVTGTAEAGAKVALTVSDVGTAHTVTVFATASDTGTWSATPNLSALDQGTASYTTTATDPAGNTGTAASATSTKDTVAPAAPTLAVPTYVNRANVTAVAVSGTAEASGTVSVSVTDPGSVHTVPGGPIATGSGGWSLTMDLTALNQGTLTYTATAKDAAGNTGPSTVATNTKDTIVPLLTMTTPRYVNIATKGSVEVSGNREAGAVVNLTVTDKAGLTVPGQALGTGPTWAATMDLTSLADGALTYVATTSDAAGNSTTSTAPGPNSKDTLAPTVTAITGLDGSSSGRGRNALEKGDTISVTYSEAMAPGTLCSGWTGSAMNGTATVSNNGTNDTVTYSPGTGTCNGLSIGLGADYVGATSAVFTGSGGNASVLTWDAGTSTLTIKFGDLKSGSITNPSTQGIPSYTPAGSLTDLAGNPIAVIEYFGSKTTF